jgi:hypothetical protein
VHQRESPYQVLSTPGFSGADLDRAERLAHSCEVFYNQGKAVPWFAILLAALELTPAQCFARFADYLDGAPAGDVTELQAGFVTAAFEADPNPGLATVAADIATYFGRSGALAEAALRLPPPLQTDTPRLTPHACFAAFNHDPEALLDQLGAGITELEDLTFMLPPRPCEALLYLDQGEPRLRTLEPFEASLLRRCQEGLGLEGAPGASAPWLRSMVEAGVIIR